MSCRSCELLTISCRAACCQGVTSCSSDVHRQEKPDLYQREIDPEFRLCVERLGRYTTLCATLRAVVFYRQDKQDLHLGETNPQHRLCAGRTGRDTAFLE